MAEFSPSKWNCYTIFFCQIYQVLFEYVRLHNDVCTKFQRVKTLKTNKITQMNGHKKNKKKPAEYFIFF